MQYMLLIYGDESSWDGPFAETKEQLGGSPRADLLRRLGRNDPVGTCVRSRARACHAAGGAGVPRAEARRG
jgi:hypothetical protein